MIVVVNDACLLIDLVQIDLFDEFLQLEFDGYITSSVLSELEGDQSKQVVQEGISQGRLNLYILNDSDQNELKNLALSHSGKLSEPDLSCLLIAKKISAVILTCEKVLTKTARNLDIQVHGSIWVLDQLIEAAIITKKTAARKLRKLMAVNERLPENECKMRLKLWD